RNAAARNEDGDSFGCGHRHSPFLLGKTPLVVFPLFHRVAMKNSPFRALGKDRRFRPLRRATEGAAFGNRKPFEKGLTEHFN
ncbi:MAG: hypothetical protein IKC97_00300, partial [Clostridia bacterium]|nr:hypothetical protein [Clostridia bacterium]